MLPDYPKVKREFDCLFNRYVKARVNAYLNPIFSKMRHQRQFEGDSMITHWAHGQDHEEPMELVSEHFSVSRKDLPMLTLDAVVQRLDEFAEAMAGKMSKQMFASMSEIIDKAGQSRDARGQQLTPESLLEVMDGLEMDFSGGEFRPPELITSPELFEKAKEASYALLHDPIYRKKLELLLQKKHEEWCAREADRKLDG